MNIDYQELKDTVQRAKFEFGEELSYSGISFLLFPCEYQESEKKVGASPVFYKPSSQADWDIYFSTDIIAPKFRKPILLHEILEVEQFTSLRNTELSSIKAKNQAHKIARIYDDQLARELLDDENYKEYCDLKKEWLNNYKKHSDTF